MNVPALLTVPMGTALFWTVILPLEALGGTVAAIRAPPLLTTMFVIFLPFSLTIGFLVPLLKPTPLILTLVPARPVAGRKPVTERVTV
jgi:hypothetical protein